MKLSVAIVFRNREMRGVRSSRFFFRSSCDNANCKFGARIFGRCLATRAHYLLLVSVIALIFHSLETWIARLSRRVIMMCSCGLITHEGI